ncbi:MAG: hypothetical protein Kow0069_26090 [Promethearchaeota archaeon]
MTSESKILTEGRAAEVLARAVEVRLPPLLESLTEEELLGQIPRVELRDVYWDELEVGQWAAVRVRVTWKWILLFAMISGDYNPIHVDPQFAAGVRAFGGKNIAHGALSNAFLSGVGGVHLLGGGIYLREKGAMKFHRAVKAGSELVAYSEVAAKFTEEIGGKERYFVELDSRIYLVEGESLELAVSAPSVVGVLRKSRESA